MDGGVLSTPTTMASPLAVPSASSTLLVVEPVLMVRVRPCSSGDPCTVSVGPLGLLLLLASRETAAADDGEGNGGAGAADVAAEAAGMLGCAAGVKKLFKSHDSVPGMVSVD